MSKCFACKHFKQSGTLDLQVSGHCAWIIPVPLPKWLENLVTSGDRYHGPRKEVGRGLHTIWNCAAFEEADEAVIAKRQSEDWHE